MRGVHTQKKKKKLQKTARMHAQSTTTLITTSHSWLLQQQLQRCMRRHDQFIKGDPDTSSQREQCFLVSVATVGQKIL